MQPKQTQFWHHLNPDELQIRLQSNYQHGLDSKSVLNRQQEYGANQLTLKQHQSPLMLFLLQFHQPLVYILLLAAIVTFLLQEWVNSSVIFGVILVNAIVGFIQESKALQAIDALSKHMQGSATVLRDGKKISVNSSQLVPGDVVLLQSGQKVPADIRLLHCRNLQIDESSLTGESVAVNKQQMTLAENTLLADRSNMAYFSTLVTYGTGKGVVVNIGDTTEIGKINRLVAEAPTLMTPLTHKISLFSQRLLKIILLLAALTLVAGWLRGDSLSETFMASVALAVGAIPEGLPAAISIMLAIGVSKMAKHHAIIRRMPATEALGSTTVICSDKTGTLTQNKMTVQQLYAGDINYQLTGSGYDDNGEILPAENLPSNEDNPLQNQALLETLKAGLLCNDTQLLRNAETTLVEGDPTEAALLISAAKAGFDRTYLQQSYPRLDSLAFESQTRYMASLHHSAEIQPAQNTIYIKGSVESILKRCKYALDADNQWVALDSEKILDNIDHMAKKGLRILAFAKKHIAPEITHLTHESIDNDLIFLGLQAMMDPPRPEAITAIQACQQAGIEVKMITGDHLITATAIARQIGLVGASQSKQEHYAYSGKDLAELNDEELRAAARYSSVFARVMPEQKLRLVEALQADGHVVAMTGDGVNDAPALKQADIGIAMGQGGTEVAQEAADMILTDDNFATIEAAVEEGRNVFDNLVKFITWTLPTNAGEGLVIMTAIALNITLPITPVQILWINMTTALLLGMMLAFENKEPGIMSRKPRKPNAPIINGELFLRIITVSALILICAYALFYWALSHQYPIEVARTLAVNMFVFAELFYLFNCRSLRYSIFRIGFFSNPWLLLGVVLMILVQLFFTYHPIMNHLFGSSPLNLLQWLAILLASLMIYAIVELEKRYRYQREGLGQP
ncbi:cation-transporting P-type ATPase [Thiomicrorhabdus sediminis]|uniref:Cation-transporting P-type ATPase n=1 Tax=Thiomicrorhabdus sediminis TaxID=2580412 RepID=A0A4P9K723_9GAMM|nr:cation-transporting P-type ATPase [Thiomicrorhabdus sediminis]QCU90904.1 cation-transporting P-type ATPase [Thiomicrorhabdus sediminis]